MRKLESMANKAGKLGTIEIRDAKELFEKSRETGEPDFRYAALAIGKNPLIPPMWAIEACISERRRTERIAAFKSPDKHNDILDAMAVSLIEHSLGHSNAGDVPKKISVRALLWKAAKSEDYVSHKTDDNALRRIGERWKEEQKQVGDDTIQIGGHKLTPRIERIKDELFAEEFGVSKDPAVDAYWEYRRQIMRDPLMANTDID